VRLRLNNSNFLLRSHRTNDLKNGLRRLNSHNKLNNRLFTDLVDLLESLLRRTRRRFGKTVMRRRKKRKRKKILPKMRNDQLRYLLDHSPNLVLPQPRNLTTLSTLLRRTRSRCRLNKTVSLNLRVDLRTIVLQLVHRIDKPTWNLVREFIINTRILFTMLLLEKTFLRTTRCLLLLLPTRTANPLSTPTVSSLRV